MDGVEFVDDTLNDWCLYGYRFLEGLNYSNHINILSFLRFIPYAATILKCH